MKPKYKRRTGYVLIDKSRIWNANGCHSYIVYNQSNVNVTLNNVLVLRPGQFMSGPTENFDIVDHSVLDIQFDMVNDPAIVQPDTGPAPISKSFNPGDPPPIRDTRVIIIQSFLSEA